MTSTKPFIKKHLTALNTPFSKILHIDLPPLFVWSRSSELSEVLSQTTIPILPQIKQLKKKKKENLLCLQRGSLLTATATYWHTLFYCTSVYCASEMLHFHKLKVCAKSTCVQQVVSTIRPTRFAHFVLHFSKSHDIQTYSLVLYLL